MIFRLSVCPRERKNADIFLTRKPLDPLFRDKALILALWNFRYSWEFYAPAVKRKYGYYTLPVLYGGRFVDGSGPIRIIKKVFFM